MTDTSEQVLEEARQHGETLTARELVRMIERFHRPDGPGITHETVKAYDKAIVDDAVLPFAEGQLVSSIEKNLSDGERWHDADAYYALGDDRTSIFPKAWHERLADSADVREYVAVIEDDTSSESTESNSARGGIGTGVPEQLLLDAIIVIDGVERETAKERFESDRRDGGLVQDADQHPDARVYLSEETEDMGDDWLDY